MSGNGLSFSELALGEPGLQELERRVRGTRDDGQTSFFCSNHAWLPLASALREMVGVGRRGWSGRTPGDPLYDSNAYEIAYLHLSRQMPGCRACGCQRFHPWRERQLAVGREE